MLSFRDFGFPLRGPFVFQLFSVSYIGRAHGAARPHNSFLLQSSLLQHPTLVLPVSTSWFTPLLCSAVVFGVFSPHQFCSYTQYWASSHGSFPVMLSGWSCIQSCWSLKIPPHSLSLVILFLVSTFYSPKAGTRERPRK